jgi:hypothetical protein
MNDRPGQPPVFVDDESLRQALKRAAADHRAPAALRSRVEAAMAMEFAPPAVEVKPDPSSAVRTSGLRKLVMALTACALFVAAFMAYRAENPTVDPIEASRETLRAMVALHDNPDRSAGNEVIALDAATQPTLPIEQTLASKLGRAMPLLASVGPDFRVKDVRLCTIIGSRVARIGLVNGATRVTLISVATDSYTNFPDGSTYDVVIDGKPMSGYASSGSVNCLVGDASTDRALLSTLRDRLKASMPVAPAQSRVCPRTAALAGNL